MLPTPFTLSTDKRQNRSLTQDGTPFLNNIFFQYTNPLPFETEPHSIHTIPLAREHCDPYLYYLRYRTLEITHHKPLFKSFSTQSKDKHWNILQNNSSTKHYSFYTRCVQHLYAKTH